MKTLEAEIRINNKLDPGSETGGEVNILARYCTESTKTRKMS